MATVPPSAPQLAAARRTRAPLPGEDNAQHAEFVDPVNGLVYAACVAGSAAEGACQAHADRCCAQREAAEAEAAAAAAAASSSGGAP